MPRKQLKEKLTKKGVTRLVFVGGSVILGILTLMLGYAMFADHVPKEKMDSLAFFIPTAWFALGAIKGHKAHTEVQEAIASLKKDQMGTEL